MLAAVPRKDCTKTQPQFVYVPLSKRCISFVQVCVISILCLLLIIRPQTLLSNAIITGGNEAFGVLPIPSPAIPDSTCTAASSSFKLHRGLWITLPFESCSVRYSEDNSLHRWTDHAADKNYEDDHYDWYQQNLSNPFTAIVDDERSQKRTVEYCQGNPLFDTKSQSHSVYYLPEKQCHYRILNETEQDTCYASHGSILLLGDSTMREMSCAMKASDSWTWQPLSLIMGRALSSYSQYTYTESNSTDDRNASNYNLSYCFVPPSKKTGDGLTAMNRTESLLVVRDIVRSRRVKTVIFNSLLHDIVHQMWYQDGNDLPLEYHDRLQRLWLFLLQDCGVETLYIWSGINPTFSGRYKNLVFQYGLYVNAMLDAANDFVLRFADTFGSRVKFIDTAHVSDGHTSEMYSDGVHYFDAAMQTVNNSGVVAEMAIQIILNQLCL